MTSQIYTRREFGNAFAQHRIISHASAHFLPSEINLPDYTDDHHVSFKAADAHGYLYSEEGRQFARKIVNFDVWAARLRERQRSYEENLQSLEKAVKIMLEDVGRFSALGRIIRNKPIEQQASILAYVTLDAQLTFVREV